MRQVDVAVIGGGPAGMAAAVAAREAGAPEVVILERDYDLGGILPQCIHDGFGVLIMKERLTGPEYADHFKDLVKAAGVDTMLGTMVLDIAPGTRTGSGDGFTVTAVNPEAGVFDLQARAVVLAMGCRERTRAQIMIPGSRPAGVYTAGTAQRLVNIEGVLPGRRAVILGSGDIGLIMARRLHLEGVQVEGVYEVLPRPSGLTRNVVQCLEDYGIPLHLNHTITEIHGRQRVEAVTVSRVDEDMNPVPGSERRIDCDTVILSVGLIPENELSEKAGVVLDERTRGPVVDENMQTSVPGLFACGNVVNVYDLVDYVTYTGQSAGRGAALYARGELAPEEGLPVLAGENVQYVVPQIIHPGTQVGDARLYLRVGSTASPVRVRVKAGDQVLAAHRLKIVRPPEMVVITIPEARIRHLAGGEMVVDVLPARGNKA